MDVAPGIGHLEDGVGTQLGLPAGLVEQVVVPGAQQDEVVEAGRTASAEPDHVVRLAPFRGPVATREATVLVSHHER